MSDLCLLFINYSQLYKGLRLFVEENVQAINFHLAEELVINLKIIYVSDGDDNYIRNRKRKNNMYSHASVVCCWHFWVALQSPLN